ncbi:MAG: CapA family protein [Syntrophobacteraceae bacterium]
MNFNEMILPLDSIPPEKVSHRESGDVRVLIGGDICPVHRIEAALCKADLSIIEPLAALFEIQDVVVGNLECVLTSRGRPIAKTGPHLKASPHCAKGLKAAGFDVLTLANNHIMDMGAEGLHDTLSACKAYGLETVGAGFSWADITQPLLIERHGTRIAIINLAENEFSTASPHNGTGCCPMDLVHNIRQIRKARSHVEFVVAVVHGGSELYPLPSPHFAERCRFLVEMGADAVICHHTHVLSGMEYHLGKPIIYGTGNLLFDNPSQAEGWYIGMMVELTFCRNSPTSVRLFPYEQCRKNPGLRTLSQVETAGVRDTMTRLSQSISHAHLLEAAWESFCRERESHYVSRIFCMNRFESILYRKGIRPFWRLNKAHTMYMLNFLRCESHRELLITLLSLDKKVE